MEWLNVVVSVAVFLVGLWIVISTLVSAVKTFVLPRGANVWLTRQVFLNVRKPFTWRALKQKTYEDRDRVMALYAPTALLTLPLTWMVASTFGFLLMFRASGTDTWIGAFALAGSSLLTLGIAQPISPFQTALVFSAAVLGLILMALLIAYLPTMYATFSKREQAVALLEVRAGSPPTGTELLTLAYGWSWDSVFDLFQAWEAWFVELGETHTSLGPLSFFRSPKSGNSWVTASGAVLDGASLMLSSVDLTGQIRGRAAGLCIRSGYLALRGVCDFFNIHYNPDPAPTDPISITRDEFDEAYNVLAEAGMPMLADRDQCWRDFAGWRVNYDGPLLALAALTMAPYAPWSSDRSFLRYRRPQPNLERTFTELARIALRREGGD